MSGARVGLIAACEDKQLFGFRLWKRQRELLAALERGPRLHVWALGRRSGKTTLGRAIAALKTAMGFAPKSAASYNDRGLIYRDTNRAAEATECFDRAAELDPKMAIASRTMRRLES